MLAMRGSRSMWLGWTEPFDKVTSDLLESLDVLLRLEEIDLDVIE